MDKDTEITRIKNELAENVGHSVAAALAGKHLAGTPDNIGGSLDELRLAAREIIISMRADMYKLLGYVGATKSDVAALMSRVNGGECLNDRDRFYTEIADMFFSDTTLTRAVSVGLSEWIERAASDYGSTIAEAYTEMLRELIAQKWTLERPPEQPERKRRNSYTYYDLFLHGIDKISDALFDKQFPQKQFVYLRTTPEGQTPAGVAVRYETRLHENSLLAQMSLPLDAVDWHLYWSMYSAWVQGNKEISIYQLYNAGKRRGHPGPKTIEEIAKRVLRMASGFVWINNDAECAAGMSYPKTRIVGERLLDIKPELTLDNERITGGRFIFRVPYDPSKPDETSFILGRFADSRDQMGALPVAVLGDGKPLQAVAATIRKYLYRRIDRATGKTITLLLNTVYEKCSVSPTAYEDRSRRKRILDTLADEVKQLISAGVLAQVRKRKTTVIDEKTGAETKSETWTNDVDTQLKAAKKERNKSKRKIILTLSATEYEKVKNRKKRNTKKCN